ncbi:uncharacterized protein LOC135502859 [Lineus longissimus]|uniref:uncharacterized protein LOC135502859 n=1 Tax=Lineus longissimus TaxID=88925 RepID=UPI00315CEC73
MEKLGRINQKIAALRPLFEAKLQQAAPLIHDLKSKVYEYDKRHKTDKILILGSTGNNLYFPETNENGTYTIEIDILFERDCSNLSLPTEFGFGPGPTVALEEAQAIKFGAPLNDDLYIWLRATRVDNPDGLGDMFLDFDEAEGVYYLKNLVYRDAIPSRTEEILDHTILEEKELLILRPESESGQPFRTFKTDLKSVNLEDENGTSQEFKFQCLFDKVAGVKIPWPRAAQEWVTRKRRWPPQSLIEAAVQYGCHGIPKAVNKRNALIGGDPDKELEDSDGKDCQEKGAETPPGTDEQASAGMRPETPLPMDDPERMRSWKLSYAWAEQMIANAFSPMQRMAYLMLKQMKREHLDK